MLKRHFGDRPLGEIDAQALQDWWDQEIGAAGRDVRTGDSYFACLQGIFESTARRFPKLQLESPVPGVRKQLIGDVHKTAKFKAKNEANKNPLTVEDMVKLLDAAEARRREPDLLPAVLILYETGMRLGEACALRWSDLWTGRDEDDTNRHVVVSKSRRYGVEGPTKTGKTRQIHLSRRLRSFLLELRMARGRPADSTRILRSHHYDYERLRLAVLRACKDAGLAPHTPKDLRDTFATALLVHGSFNLKYIARQLGHSSSQTTEAHYARWVDEDGYRNPWVVPEGRLPTDLFAEVDGWSPGRATRLPLRATAR